MTTEGHDEEMRHRRRAWIAAHHPDRGGDPHEFAAGLAQFDPSPSNGLAPSWHRPTVHRSRNPLRRLRRLLRRATTGSRARRLL